MAFLALQLLLSAAVAGPIPVRHALGTLHGFPSMSDSSGRVIADGELVQEVVGDRLVVRARWSFADGRRAEEHDEFRIGRTLSQERFSWVETRAGQEARRFEVDFSTGQASAASHDEQGEAKRDEAKLDLPPGRAFAGYGTALAVSELGLGAGEEAELTFVAFTQNPRTVTLQVKREGEERIAIAGRSIPCDRYTLHPKIPFPLNAIAGAKDAHLWFTHAAPPGLVRAEQNLVTKDDPQVVIDVTPRGPAHASAPQGRRRPAAQRR